LIRDKKVIMGICLSRDLKETIDKARGDIPRSRYISRILKRQITQQKKTGIEHIVKFRRDDSRRQPLQSFDEVSELCHPHIPENGSSK